MFLAIQRIHRYWSLGLILFSIINFRIFWLPGFEFNSRIWDDELSWLADSQSKSLLNFIFYRDAPGYFVFIPRIMTLAGEAAPNFGSFSSLRILVLLTQLLCFAAATSCVISWSVHWKLWSILFTTLSITSVEDLNYVHNVGYLFIFPIYYFVFRRFLNKEKVKYSYVFFASLLICKPFTAVLVLCCIFFFIFIEKSLNKPLLFLGAYSFSYLMSYILLPHRWETPFNFDPGTAIKIVVDFPWVLFATFLPSLFIGGMGLIQVIGSEELQLLTGVGLNLGIAILTFAYRTWIMERLKTLSLATKGFILIFVLNYILVFSAANSFWIKHFPLYQLDAPHFLWLRWSAILPFTSMLIVGSISSISYSVKRNLYLLVSAQWLILAIVANSWLRRYW